MTDVTASDPVVLDVRAELGQTEPPGGPTRRKLRRHTWVLRRIMIGCATLVVVSIIIFAATQALPGNAARSILGRTQNGAAYDAISEKLGLDQPVITQFWIWAKGLFTGDLGTSFIQGTPVSSVVGPAIWHSVVLVVLAAVISITLGTLFGVIAAARRDGWVDHAFNGYAFLFTAVPEFIVGTLLVIVFATTVFQVLPAVSLIPTGESAFSHPDAYVLPVATLALAITPYLGRLVRGSMIDVLESEYVRMARLKGISERRILLRHALPNALVPTIQGSALVLGYLAGGIVLVEWVFGFSGVGTVLLQAISKRDIPVIQAMGLLLAAVYVIVNLLADVLTVYVSPRLRTSDRL